MSTAVEEFEAQPRLEPGQPGWWRVWGASVRDIRAGDIVMCKRDDGDVDTFEVQDVFAAKSVARLGIIVDGERQTLGRLCPVVVVRKGTHNTLAGSL